MILNPHYHHKYKTYNPSTPYSVIVIVIAIGLHPPLILALMAAGPALFSDIGRKAKDLLTNDYNYDQKFCIFSHSNLGLELTSTAVKKDGFSIGEMCATYKNENTVLDAKIDTESNISMVASLSEILPGTNFISTLRFPRQSSGKIELQYFHEHTTLTTSIYPSQFPSVDLSFTIGTQSVAIGGETSFHSATGTFTKYDVGIGVTKPNSSSSILLTEKGDAFKASYLHSFNNGSALAEIMRKFSTYENTFTVGGSYAIDANTAIKGRLNNHGKLAALLQHELKTRAVLTISGEFDTKQMEKNPRFGLALALRL